MKIPKILILLSLSLVIFNPTFSKVQKRNDVDDGSIRSTDVMALDFNTIFDFSRVNDLSKLNFKVTQKPDGTSDPTPLGRVIGGVDEPFYNYEYPNTLYEKASFTKYLDDRSFVIITDNGEIIYEETSANGMPRNFDKPKHFKLSFIGANIACHDVIPWGIDLSTLIIGCISRNILTSENTIYLQLVDRKTFTPGKLTSYKLSSDSDFRIFNRIGLIEAWSTDNHGKKVPYLIVHDQGKSHYIPPSSSSTSSELDISSIKASRFTSLMRYFFGIKEENTIVLDNTHFLVFDAPDDELVYVNEFILKAGETSTFSHVYDYYWYQGDFVVTSQIKGKSVINISVCDFKISDVESIRNSNEMITIDCKDDHAATGVTDGYVAQIVGSQLWAHVENNEDKSIKVTVFNTHGNIKNIPTWTKLHTMDSIKQPSNVEHKWIRGLQGNSNNLIVKYTSLDETKIPAATKDSDSILVSWDLNLSNNHPNWSANVHDNNIYYALVDSNHIAVARISGAWWMASGDQFGDQLTNNVLFTCEEPNVNSVTIQANIHLNSKSKKIDLSSWNPPYLDIHNDSIMQIPFDHKSYRAGNDLSFSLEVDDKEAFDKTFVFKTKEINVTFSDSASKKIKKIFKKSNDQTFASIQIVNGGGAATVTYDGKLQIYGCEQQVGGVDCHGILDTPIDIKGKPSEILYKSFGGDNVQAYANTYAEGGVKKSGETYIYTAIRTLKKDPVRTNKVDYFANDIAFSEDINGIIYVAFSYLHREGDATESESFVEVYTIDPQNPSEMNIKVKLTFNEVLAEDEQDFCPTQIQFDPVDSTMIHILSDCKIKGYQYSRNKIYSYRVKASPDIANNKAISFDIDPMSEFQGVAKFCPFENNFIVYSIQANTVLTIDKNPSLSMYTIPLKDFGLSNLVTFDCMSSIGMYAIAGKSATIQNSNDQDLYNYGLFYGNHEYNDDKFVNIVLKDKELGQYLDARSYGTGDYVYTVSYKQEEGSTTHSGYTVRQTAVRAPFMWTETSNLKSQTTIEAKHKITVIASNGLISAKAEAEIVTVKQNDRFRWIGIKPWDKESGRIYVERFTKIMGPTKEVTVSGEQTKQLSFIGRTKSDGSLNPTDHQIVFDEFRGGIDRGFGLTWKEDTENTIFSLVHEGKITSQFELPITSTADFCDLKQQGGQRLIIANMIDGQRENVHAFTVEDEATSVVISTKGSNSRADKLRLVHFPGKYIGLGLDSQTGILSVWDIQNIDGEYQFNIVSHFENVQDFDPVSSKSQVFVYFIGYEQTGANVITLTPDAKGIIVSPISNIPFEKSKPYWLQSIACNFKENGLGAICAFNTIGTVIYATEIDFVDCNPSNGPIKATQVETYYKLAGFDGIHMFIDENYIVQKAWHLKTGGLSVHANIWSRDNLNKNPELHAQIQINSGDQLKPAVEMIRNHIKSGKRMNQINWRDVKKASNSFGTFAMTYFFNKDLKRNVIGIGSNDIKKGLLLYSVYDSFSIFNDPENPIDFKQFTISKDGNKGQGINLQQMLDDDVPSSGSSGSSGSSSGRDQPNAWIFITLISLLIIGAVAWFAYAQSKGHPEDENDDDGVYRTVQTNGGEFESGINPDDGENMLKSDAVNQEFEDDDEGLN